MTASDWVALTVGLGNIAIISFGLVMTRRHASQSVRPYMMSLMNFPDEDYGIGSVTLKNCGLGPAKINSITIYMNGEPYSGALDTAFKAAAEDLGHKGGIKPLGWVDYQKGHVVPKDGVMLIGRFRCTSETSNDDTRNELSRLNIKIKVDYQDMYGQKFTQLDPNEGNEL